MKNISHLAERLRSQIQQEQEAIERQTNDALKKHAESLKKLSNDALNTTKSVIKSENKQLLKSIRETRELTEAHIKKLRKMLLIAMLWPLLLTLTLCSLIVLMTWLWLPTALFNAKTETWTLSNGQKATVIISKDWTICTDHKQRQYPCHIEQQNHQPAAG